MFKAAGCTLPYSVDVDNAYVEVISLEESLIKIKFKQNGFTSIKILYNDNCKQVKDSIGIDIHFAEPFVLGPDIISCRDTAVLLTTGQGFQQYTWQDGSVGPSYLASLPGLYHVTAIDYCNNINRDSFQIIKPLPVPFTYSPVEASVCSGDSVSFSAAGGTSYQWEPSSNFSNPDAANTKAIISNNDLYTVYIIDAICGRDTLINIPVTANSKADIIASKSNDVNCSLDSAILKATGGVNYEWSPDVYITRIVGGQITVKPTTTLTYYVVGTDALGCKGMDSVVVEFRNEGQQKLFVPNAFTPNGDGLNDVFKPFFSGPARSYQFSIFNRWGQLVFRSTSPGIGWNGMYQGKVQPGGVYVYYIKAEGGCNGRFEEKGTLVLLR